MTTATEVENAWAGQGSVLLDIGGDVGALVVAMPSAMTGVEVELRPEGAGSGPDGHSHHPHVAVVNRPVGDQQLPCLVFGELAEGRYELYEKGTHDVRLRAQVRGGAVATADWPV